MLLALNGATTMKATLPEDIAATSAAGFKALEIWAAKMDDYLKADSVGELNRSVTLEFPRGPAVGKEVMAQLTLDRLASTVCLGR